MYGFNYNNLIVQLLQCSEHMRESFDLEALLKEIKRLVFGNLNKVSQWVVFLQIGQHDGAGVHKWIIRLLGKTKWC